MSEKQNIRVYIRIEDWFDVDSLPILAGAVEYVNAEIRIIDLHYKQKLSEQMMSGLSKMATTNKLEVVQNPCYGYYETNSITAKYGYIYNYLPRAVDKLKITLNIPNTEISDFLYYIKDTESLVKLHELIVKSLK